MLQKYLSKPANRKVMNVTEKFCFISDTIFVVLCIRQDVLTKHPSMKGITTLKVINELLQKNIIKK